jgi:valyl-tRNA synthetase
MELPKNYDIKECEKKWQAYWEKEKIYTFNPESKAEIFSIDTPPPTISGRMHLGHSFSYAQQDFIARFQRMLGKNVFYPFGTDDNGLPTERLIEKTKKVKGANMKRGDFIKLCLETLEEIRPSFIEGWKKIGMSCDFSVYYTTINEHCQRISQKSFIDLYKAGREYRKRTPFMWCPECQTAIAQVEMKDKETESKFVYMKFDTSIGKPITIATTRPELMPACVMVHVHPKDKRYKEFIGAKAKIPFFKREVDIMANEDVDMEFGSGAVYHCTFGDMDDVKWLEELNIPAIEIMNKDGTLNEKAGKYRGMKSKEAREAIIKDLEEAGRIEKIEPIRHVVNVHERCDTEIEILMADQWFIKYLDLKEHFLKVGKQMRWHPSHMRNRYDNWVKGLKWDWCISRQRHFGIPIPVWYCKKCSEIILPDENDLPVDPTTDKPKKACKCGSTEFIGEKDVLDTWATSSLTPQIAAELFKGTKAYDKLYPMNLRPQAHDIITFWLFNTVVKSQLHNSVNPWRDIMISGWALDPHGKKMSKSKGNVIEPQAVLEKYGADALRFWAAGSKLGEDLPYQEKDLITGKKFIVKMWNAAKFAFMHLKGYKLEKPKKLELMDLWLLSKLNTLVEESTQDFLNYEYSRTKLGTENFFWHTFCDNYLEIVKDRLYNPERRGHESRTAAQYTLYTAFLTILKLMAPIMPHITEELYHSYYKKHEKDKSIHLSKWPSLDITNKEAESIGEFAISIIQESRRVKAERNMSLKSPLKKIIAKGKISEEGFELVKQDILASTNAAEIAFEKLPRDSKIDAEIDIIV